MVISLSRSDLLSGNSKALPILVQVWKGDLLMLPERRAIKFLLAIEIIS